LSLKLDGFIDAFFDLNFVKNRTGKWFFGVISLSDSADIGTVISDGKSCSDSKLTTSILSEDFKTQTYTFRAYTGGCYYFNTSTEVWEGVGQMVWSTNLVS
jgi:hypothetical protein